MGGALPLGYEVHERKLVVNHGEAQTVKQIFERYLELGSVRLLTADLGRRGIVSGVKVSKHGNRRAGSHSRAERFTACSPIQSTSARAATSRNVILDSMSRS
jgi:hypothetical protein